MCLKKRHSRLYVYAVKIIFIFYFNIYLQININYMMAHYQLVN